MTMNIRILIHKYETLEVKILKYKYDRELDRTYPKQKF